MMGINDAVTQTSLSSFKADAATVISSIQAAGSSVLLIVPPEPTLVSPTVTWAQYQQALYEIADDNECMLLDITERWQGHDGAFFTDTYHPNNLGHVDIARALFHVVQAIS